MDTGTSMQCVLLAEFKSVGVWGTPVVYRGGWPVDCASFLYALIPYLRVSTTNFNRLMGLRFGPRRRGGDHSAWCAWLAKELDHPLHHAWEFLARLMDGRMLEILCFLLARQNHFDVEHT